MLYQNCRELPIHNFFEINRTGDLKFLVKSGEAPEIAILQEKFLDIIDEYNSLFTGEKNTTLTSNIQIIIKNIQLMNLTILQMIISTSGITDEVQETAKLLRVKPESIKTYISGLKNELNRLMKSMESSENEENSKEKSADNLEKSLILVKENGFNFDRFTTPIIEFVYAMNHLQEKSKKLEAIRKK